MSSRTPEQQAPLLPFLANLKLGLQELNLSIIIPKMDLISIDLPIVIYRWTVDCLIKVLARMLDPALILTIVILT